MNQATANHIVERARRLFGDTSCRLQVAALPWRRVADGVEIMLITSRDTGRWVLPKGWMEKGEHFWDAAEREASEEAGLEGSVSHREVGRYFYTKNRSKGDCMPCEVILYPLEVARIADQWKERGERTRRWFRPIEASEMVQEPDLADVLARFSGPRE